MLARLWRPLLALGGILIVIGGPMHPGGTMAEMLADPAWIPSHSWVLAGFVALTLAILGYWRAVAESPTMRRWAGLAFAGTLLQTIEMFFHLIAYLDLDHLVAGEPTPILTTHLNLAVVAYPIFGVLTAGAIVAGVRTGELGRWWFAPLGILGALAHGIAPVLVVTFEIEEARKLFPMVLLFAVWTLCVALMPRRAGQAVSAPA